MRIPIASMVGIAAAALAAPAAAQAGGVFADLAAARTFASAAGEDLWPGYGAAPFGLLLVESARETLLCRAGGAEGFVAEGVEPATGCPRFGRPPSGLPGNLLAAMPVFGPPSTIVMGTPEATGRSREAWVHTILHEHFHQWQSALPDYYARVAALDLAGDDDSGMWMLNFPFPYDDAGAGAAFARASLALADALEARGGARFQAAFDRYLAARTALAAQVGARNWRYLEFQLWQEGVARWTEISLGLAYPDDAVRASAARLAARVAEQLRAPDLAARRREVAYPLGAGEAMLMDACGSGWRRSYPGALALGPLLAAARAGCGA